LTQAQAGCVLKAKATSLAFAGAMPT